MTRRPIRMVAVLATGLAVALAALAGCGVPLDGEPREITVATQPAQTTSTLAAGDGQSVSVYFIDGDRLVARRVPVDEPTLDAALGQVLSVEPTGSAKTRIPPGTSLRAPVVVQDRVARIDLTSEIVDDIQGEPQKQAFAQVAFTAFGFDGVSAVAFLVDGEPIEAPTDEGGQATIMPGDYAEPLNPD